MFSRSINITNALIAPARQVKTRVMDQPPNPALLDEITGALDWWRDAGVDCDFLDDPIEWLAPPASADTDAPVRRRAEPKVTPDAAPPPARLGPASLPADLAAFTPWWLTEPLLCEGGPAARVPPHGKAGAELMIVVEEPEADDGDALLSGPHGRLLDAMLAAFDTRRADVYLASALPRHTPGTDWATMNDRGIGQVLAHHIGLVAPKRLMIMGKHVLSLINHEPPQPAAMLTNFNHEGATIPLLASWALPSLYTQTGARAVLWKAWLDWTAP